MNFCDLCDPNTKTKMKIPHQPTALNFIPFNYLLTVRCIFTSVCKHIDMFYPIGTFVSFLTNFSNDTTETGMTTIVIIQW